MNRASHPDLCANAVGAVRKFRHHSEADIADLISVWCGKAKAPSFDAEGKSQLIQTIRDLLSTPVWRDDFVSDQRAVRAGQRTRDVVEALKLLQAELPQFIEDWRDQRTPAPIALTITLRELVEAHKAWIDALPILKRGKPKSGERDVASLIAQKALKLWNGEAGQMQADGFAAEAMTWLLDKPQSDEAISKARRRRAKPSRT